MARQVSCVHISDAWDAEAVEHALERLLLRSLERLDEVPCRDLPEPLELGKAVRGEAVEVRGVADQLFRKETTNVLFAEPVDVHRAHEVLHRLEDLAGAPRPVGADRPDASLGL